MSRGVHRAARGDDGALLHERRGLIGCIKEWAGDSREETAVLIAKLVRRLDLKVCPFVNSLLDNDGVLTVCLCLCRIFFFKGIIVRFRSKT